MRGKRENLVFVCLVLKNKNLGHLIKILLKKYCFEVVDTTKLGYELLLLSFDNIKPKFINQVKKEGICICNKNRFKNLLMGLTNVFFIFIKRINIMNSI